ncbi:MAG: glutamate-5-semialdehyde dehydrogenase [Myxococcota bacterium]|nr:glutamate-5-semialdehyde dehydrogenase [Myxococcota bacterium]
MTPAELARAARSASRKVQSLSSADRQYGLEAMAAALCERQQEILKANAMDVADAQLRVQAGDMSSALAARLKLTEEKLVVLAEGLRSLAQQEEPLGRVLRHSTLAEGLELTQETVALGVVLVIFESRPDVLPQLAGLALRSGNGLLLKGGREAIHSNRKLHEVLVEAVEPRLPGSLFGLVETREEVGALLSLDDCIDLVVPRGSAEMVRSIQEGTRIPVLGHADGICHVFVDKDAHAEKAEAIVVDAKTDYPAACNAMETLLIHSEYPSAQGLLSALAEAGVRVFGGPRAAEAHSLPRAQSLSHEYGDLAVCVEIVDGVGQAIEHIHAHGSGHTESVVTESEAVARQFLSGVDSACVFHNASTRFADGFRFGLGAEVGISTARIHARGPVGVDGLLTTRWRLTGQGDTVGPFSRGEREFLHSSS